MEKDKRNVTVYKDYTIITEEGVQKGIFFRSPFQMAFFDAYYGDMPFDAYTYAKKIKNPIRRFYEILIGNKNIVKSIGRLLDNIDWAGFDARIVVCPIYFKRRYRRLRAYTPNKDMTVREIKSYGYEFGFELAAGDCHIEKTKIYIRDGNVITTTKKDQYHYTYRHVVKEEIIDTGNVTA